MTVVRLLLYMVVVISLISGKEDSESCCNGVKNLIKNQTADYFLARFRDNLPSIIRLKYIRYDDRKKAGDITMNEGFGLTMVTVSNIDIDFPPVLWYSNSTELEKPICSFEATNDIVRKIKKCQLTKLEKTQIKKKFKRVQKEPETTTPCPTTTAQCECSATAATRGGENNKKMANVPDIVTVAAAPGGENKKMANVPDVVWVILALMGLFIILLLPLVVCYYIRFKKEVGKNRRMNVPPSSSPDAEVTAAAAVAVGAGTEEPSAAAAGGGAVSGSRAGSQGAGAAKLTPAAGVAAAATE